MILKHVEIEIKIHHPVIDLSFNFDEIVWTIDFMNYGKISIIIIYQKQPPGKFYWNLAKFTGKHLCQGLFFNNVAGFVLFASCQSINLPRSFEHCLKHHMTDILSHLCHTWSKIFKITRIFLIHAVDWTFRRRYI